MARFGTGSWKPGRRWLAGLGFCCLVLAMLLPAARSLAATATVTVGICRNAQAGICVTGPGAVVTLPMIQAQLRGDQAGLLVLEANGVWQLNATLFIDRGVTLNLTTETVTCLKLRSEANGFANLVTNDGNININGVQIHSWDPGAGTFDTDISNGRSYVLAKYNARMEIRNAELSYLGALQTQGYGVSWVDTDQENGTWRTRVTGLAINSDFHHNYYGIYTFQAANMTFRGNKFHHNISYGFDPHDYSHHMLVEDNEAFENGLHGFIISRGCHDFIFRRNRSFDNGLATDTADRNAHGFMLDPGSPLFPKPQAPSYNNLLEDNHAWGNTGYGLRILRSHGNTIRNNVFENHLQGITVELDSTNNLLEGNTVTGNQLHGIFLRPGADGNTVRGNTVSRSGTNGIYVKSSNNTVIGNTVSDHGNRVNGTPEGSGILLLVESDTSTSVAGDFRLPTGVQATGDPELVGEPQASVPTGNVVKENTVARNAEHGIELNGAVNTLVEANDVSANNIHGIYLKAGASNNRLVKNTIYANAAHGIRASTANTAKNSWSENVIYDNGAAGIIVTENANEGIQPPSIS
ncbi:MAG TPA: right-handed parallel beta-helix repeat-containing protein, partial [Herpetosiphonaceae bacterium]|nr:right-handed parallel beta-helix repeat-containing protein [Herpetosiphonaceae bacterium]